MTQLSATATVPRLALHRETVRNLAGSLPAGPRYASVVSGCLTTCCSWGTCQTCKHCPTLQGKTCK
jgi:hypothetical protein